MNYFHGLFSAHAVLGPDRSSFTIVYAVTTCLPSFEENMFQLIGRLHHNHVHTHAYQFRELIAFKCYVGYCSQEGNFLKVSHYSTAVC